MAKPLLHCAAIDCESSHGRRQGRGDWPDTLSELRLAQERMRETLAAARAGLESAKRDLASINASVRTLLRP